MDLAFNRLTQLAFGYWHAQPLFSLSSLGVFELLGEGGKTPGEVAGRCGIAEEGAGRLLCAGVASGLLRLEGERFHNTELAGRFLVSWSPESLSHWVRVMGRWAGPWSRMDEALRLGRPVESQSLRLGEDRAYLEDFILGMHEYARRTSREVAAAIVEMTGLAGKTQQRAVPGSGGELHLIDVGGGAGTYSIALCEAIHELRVTLLDLEPVLELAREELGRAGFSARIDTAVVDYRQDVLGEGADAILMSNVLHQESPEVGLEMLERARCALCPGGFLIVHGHFLGPDRCRPAFSVLHSLSALALWEGGGGYTQGEMADLVAKAGFEAVGARAIAASATGLVVGRRGEGF